MLEFQQVDSNLIIAKRHDGYYMAQIYDRELNHVSIECKSSDLRQIADKLDELNGLKVNDINNQKTEAGTGKAECKTASNSYGNS